MIQVLHVIAGSLNGGAAKGAMNLHRYISAPDITSKILTNDHRISSSDSVSSMFQKPQQKLWAHLLPSIGSFGKHFYVNRQKRLFNTGFEGFDIRRHPFYESADILHLHWINGLVAVHNLRKIDKPIIWTLRDMWPMTGGCHYSMGCERFKHGCGSCPQLGSGLSYDLSRLVVWNKSNSYPLNMRLVGISRWLSGCAAESEVFRKLKIDTIPNSIDLDIFRAVDQKIACETLALNRESKKVLIGANSVIDFYKGFDLFVSALKKLEGYDFEVLVFGNIPFEARSYLPSHTQYFGYVENDATLRMLYSAADVFVAPSRQEAFGKTLVESLACGTPVVCFDATGPKDIIQHKTTGYKAIPFEPEDLADGIIWVLSQSKKQQKILGENAISASKRYSGERIAHEYIKIYRELLQ